MPLIVEAQETGLRVRLEGEFTIFQASEYKQPLLDCVHKAPELEVDLAWVEEIDTAGVQLMLLLKREAVRLGHEVVFSHHSHAVLDVINLLHLTGPLGDPVLITR